MLLHVIAPTRSVDRSANLRSALRRLISLDVVNDAAVFGFDDFRDLQPLRRRIRIWSRHPACVIDLAAAGRIERGAIEKHAMPLVNLRRWNNLGDFPLELIQKRI